MSARWTLASVLLVTLPAITGCDAFLCHLGFNNENCPKRDPGYVPDLPCWSHEASGDQGECDNAGDAEPNDTVPLAHELPGAGCGQSTLSGTLRGDDVDVFRAFGTLCINGDPGPTIQVDGSGARACLFIQCETGSTSFGEQTKGDEEAAPCSADGAGMRSPEGLFGCCTTSGAPVSSRFGCSSAKKNVHAFIVVDGLSGPASTCEGYTVNYHL